MHMHVNTHSDAHACKCQNESYGKEVIRHNASSKEPLPQANCKFSMSNVGQEKIFILLTSLDY